MIITPKITGVIARSAHPQGCQQAVNEQIAYCQQHPTSTSAKNVLILGASSGFGLAARICLGFGGSHANTIGVSFERGTSERGTGSAGWFNNHFFEQQAMQQHLTSSNIVGDAFSAETREQVCQQIIEQCNGKVDLVIYSLATGLRPKATSGEFWRSTIKPVGEPYSGYSVDLEQQRLVEAELPPADQQEIEATLKVMGGEDWAEWIALLQQRDLLASGCRTLAFSYVGPPHTYPIYHHGTLGLAKQHLHATVDDINQQLTPLGGQANVAVCKALVTKASVFIPGLAPYIMALFKVMKEKGVHEGCIEQMQRLFAQQYSQAKPGALIRLDDWELREDVQAEVNQILAQLTPDNMADLVDFAGYYQDFMQLNGFGFTDIDYNQPVDLANYS